MENFFILVRMPDSSQAKNVPVLTDGVINLDSLSTETVIGYMFGGIAADQPNFGTTVASSIIFEVTYAPQSD
jgi:hypothetical protein